MEFGNAGNVRTISTRILVEFILYFVPQICEYIVS